MSKHQRKESKPIQHFFPNADEGLNSSQVCERIAQGLTNVTPPNTGKTVGQIIFTNVFTYFNFVFAIFAVFLIIAKSYKSLTFMPVIIINTLIGIVQELRAKRVLDRLNLINAPKSEVIRDSVKKSVDSNMLVLDDVVVLCAGNQICADAEVLCGEIQVNEALLTGEADETAKRTGEKLLSGSFVVSGKCRARLTAVGAESYISKLTSEAKNSKAANRSPMLTALDKIIKIVGVAIIPLGAALVITRMLVLNVGLDETIVSTVAALIGMIPEGLYLLASIALAVSVIRLAEKNVLVHEMGCIESLARVDVLCVDKTGTITSDEMSVEGLLPLPCDEFKKTEMPFRQLLCDFAFAAEDSNITSSALRSYFKDDVKSHRKVISATPFSSKAKYSSVKFEDGTFVLGAPEFVMREQYGEIKKTAKKYFLDGLRVLVLAYYHGEANGRELSERVTPLGLVMLTNPIRENAKETFSYFNSQGVEIKVISGDNPATVSEVARKAGIKNAKIFVDASELKTDAMINEAAEKYTVFGRTTPEQKRKLIRAIKANGHTVAMTGDGVNDILAFKDSDCSIAMASGSEAAGQAAQLVLLDSDFSRMPKVVSEGRRVVNNIQRSASLFVVKNIFSLLTTLFAVIALHNYPLEPAQISLAAAFTIGAPAFLLAMEPNRDRITGNFLSSVMKNAIPAGMTDFLLVSAMLIITGRLGFSAQEIKTSATFILAFVGLVMVIKTSMPLSKYRTAVAVLCTVLLAATGFVLKGIFNFVLPCDYCILITAVLSVMSVPLMILLTKLTKWMWSLFDGFGTRCKKIR